MGDRVPTQDVPSKYVKYVKKDEAGKYVEQTLPRAEQN